MKRSRYTDEFSFVLGPSEVHGVGVFTVHNIDEGVVLHMMGDDTWRTRRKAPPRRFQRYCFRVPGGWRTPISFLRPSVITFLNHSKMPNAGHTDWVYRALRPIKRGEEITINYRTLK